MTTAATTRRVIGRYVLYDEIACGGMAAVHFGRLVGPVGFARTVAIKRLHAHLAREPEFVAMFLDEARLAARIRHPNVVPTLDIAVHEGELLLVMEYIQGESLSRLTRAAERKGGIPPQVASSLCVGLLEGLHAAHEATNDRGEPLGLVHRDVSPQNVIVGEDGLAHVLDFGVAKATGRVQETGNGQVKGKFAYMSPEQLRNEPIDRRTDVFAATIVLWETLTGMRLFKADDPASVVYQVAHAQIPPPSSVVRGLSPEVDRVVMRGLERDADRRYSTAREMALELERALPPASPLGVQAWLAGLVDEVLKERARRLRDIECDSSVTSPAAIAELLTPALAGSRAQLPIQEPSSSVSTMGQITPIAPAETPRKRSTTAMAIGIAATFGIGLAVVAASLTGPATSPAASHAGPPAATPAIATSPAQAAAADADGATADLAPEASSLAAATALPSAMAAVVGVPASTTEANTLAAKQPPTPAISRPPAVKAGKPDCKNPFVVDATGKKRPRPECF